MKKISILVPCYNEEKSLPMLYDALKAFMDEHDAYEWEVLLVNDGSTDDSLNEIRRLHELDDRISYVDLSRNYGKEVAMLAGFDYVTGDCAVVMDADLQHPVSVIPEMIAKWEEGYEDVYGERITRGKESWLRKKFSLLYYKLLQKSTRLDVLKNVGDFRLLDRRCIDALKQIREQGRYTKGLYSWIGFKKAGVEFEQADRVAGKTSWSFFKLLGLAIEGFVSFTTAPLKFAIFIGLFVSLAAFAYMIYVFVRALIYGDPVAGFPTLAILILFLGGCILLCLGIIGIYLSRIFVETKNRPTYFAREYNKRRI